MKRSRAVILTIAVAGCSAPSIKIEDMPTEVSKTICTRYYECCTAAEAKDNQGIGPDQAGCETKYKTALDISKNFATASETKMRVVYHGDKLASCMAAYKKLSCNELKKSADDLIQDCAGFYEPKVAVGSACSQDFDCISGSCRGATTTADGTCAAKAGEGTSCADADCAKGSYCKSGTGTDGGFAQTCVTQKADGTACATNGECSTGGCNGKNPDGGMPNMGTCGEKGGPGTTCYATDGCSVSGGSPLVLALIALALRRRKT